MINIKWSKLINSIRLIDYFLLSSLINKKNNKFFDKTNVWKVNQAINPK